MAGIHQVLDDLDDLPDVLGGPGTHGGFLHVEALGILDVFGLELAGHLLHGDALLLAFLDQLVVNIGDVGNVVDLVAAVFQVAAQRVKHDHRPGIADVDVVVDRGAADIDAVLARLLRDEFLLLAGHGVENLHGDTILSQFDGLRWFLL